MEGNKLGAPSQSPPAGNEVFHILCQVSQVGHIIGKSGRVIKQLQESAKSYIWVEKAPLDSPYCVIKIIAHVGLTSTVRVGVTDDNASNREKEEQEQEVEVSRAQYALIRVFEAQNVGFRTSRSVSCRLLMEASNAVTVIGKAGELLERIWKETGCNVEIRSHDLPSCAMPGDVMVKIDGNVSAVKKALVSISSRLQACQPIYMAPLRRYTEAVPDALRRNMIEDDPHDSLHRHVEISQEDALGSVHSLTAPASKNHPVTIKPVDADPCIIPEDPFLYRFSPIARYASNFGRWSMDLNDTSHHSSQAPYGLWASPTPAAPRGVLDGSGGLSSTRDGLGFYSGLRSSNVINRPRQFRVSENAMNSVFGDGQDGQTRLQDLREISGARVIHSYSFKPRLGSSDRMIFISGTPDQIQGAQDRLLAFFPEVKSSSMRRRLNLN